MSDREIDPPSNVTCEFERRPVLHLPDGKVLVRAAGFVPRGREHMAMQTTGTFPQLTTKNTGKSKPKGKGKKGC